MRDQFIITGGLILGAMLAGYAARKFAKVGEELAERLMTVVAVAGYSVIGLLAVWVTPLSGRDLLLPALGAVHVLVLTVIALAVGKAVAREPGEVGVFAITAGFGNLGFTMGGFVCYLLFGEPGLGLTSVYGIMWTPATILIMYPIARHYVGGLSKSLPRLLGESLLDYRSIGLPLTIVGIALALTGVPRPAWVSSWRVVEILMFAVSGVAYFSVGLRLHLSHVPRIRGLIAALAGMRFVVGAGVGLLLATAPWLLGVPLSPLTWKVFVVEGFVPTAVTSVAVANMFGLRPREASILFVTNTIMYMAVVLPVVVWIFG
jgi:predicted permease